MLGLNGLKQKENRWKKRKEKSYFTQPVDKNVAIF
jgi:hypothetical protein